eukprot:353045-Chlamydomonas_euryale.AAC.3
MQKVLEPSCGVPKVAQRPIPWWRMYRLHMQRVPAACWCGAQCTPARLLTTNDCVTCARSIAQFVM